MLMTAALSGKPDAVISVVSFTFVLRDARLEGAQFTPPFHERGVHAAQERLQMLLHQQVTFDLQSQRLEHGTIAHGRHSVFVTRRDALFQIAQAVRGWCR